MAVYIIRRLLQTAFILVVTAVLAFALARFAGDPVGQMAGQQATAAERAVIRAGLGLDDSLPRQFTAFAASAARGDFGTSWQFRSPVAALVAERLPATAELAAIATLLALLIGIPAGIVAAAKPDGLLSRAVMAFSLVGVSMPTFVIGILLIYVFSASLHVLPAFGRGDTVTIGWWHTGLLTLSGLKSIAMPAATLALYQLTLVVRIVRAEMLAVLRSQHVRAARARGLPASSVYFRHALRSAAAPFAAVAGMQIGTVAAFAIVTETVFQWPGMGALFLKAIQTADVPVIVAYLLLSAVMFAAINLAVDVLQMALDPRVRDNIVGARA